MATDKEHPDTNNQTEEILESDDLFDLDLPLDTPATSLEDDLSSSLLDTTLLDELEELEASEELDNNPDDITTDIADNLLPSDDPDSFLSGISQIQDTGTQLPSPDASQNDTASHSTTESIAATEASETTNIDALAEEIAAAERIAKEAAERAASAAAAVAAAQAAEEKAEIEAKVAAEALAAAEIKITEAKAAEEARITAEAKAAEEARIAAEAKAAEEARIAAEAKAAEEARIAAEAKAAEEARIAAEAKAAEEACIAAEAKAAEEARIAAEAKAAEKARIAAEAKAAEEARIAAEEKTAAEVREAAGLTGSMGLSLDDLESEGLDDMAGNALDEFDLMDLDSEPRLTPPADEAETLASLEQDLEDMTKWAEPDSPKKTDPSPEPVQTANPATTDQHEEATMAAQTTSKKQSTGNILIFSLVFIAMAIAALAVWIGLDASQQATKLASETTKTHQQISLLEQQQKKQNTLLLQQVGNLQQQLNVLTKVISHKTTEQWRTSVEDKPVTPSASKTNKQTPAPAPKASITPATRIKKAPATSKTATPSPAKAKADVPAPARLKIPAKAAAAKPSPKSLDKPAATIKHKDWIVVIESVYSEKRAVALVHRLAAKDIQAEYVQVPVKGKIWYRIQVPGFKTARSAIAFKKFLKEFHNISSWHYRSDPSKPVAVAKKAPQKTAPTTIATATTKPARATSPAKPTIQLSNVEHRYRFEAEDAPVWLQIFLPNSTGTGKGERLKEVLLQPKHHLSIKNKATALWLTTGNAPALRIKVDGNIVAEKGSLGAGKKVMRNYKFSIPK